MKRSLLIIVSLMLVCVLLTACGNADYKKATELYEAGNYAEAAVLFTELGDYEDSAEKAVECTYLYAEELFEDGKYEEAKAEYEKVSDHEDATDKIAVCDVEIMYSAYAATIEQLKAGEWYYNGGSDTCVKQLTFADREATIVSHSWTGNGKSSSEPVVAEFTIDDSNITVKLEEELVIPYTTEGEAVKLDATTYFTPDMVVEGLQGYWHHREYSYNAILGFSQHEYNMHIDGNTIVHENACPAFGYDDGTYYYYGPYTGTFSIVDGGFESEVQNSSYFGFNIIEGKVAFIRFTDVFETSNGPLPGEDNYSF